MAEANLIHTPDQRVRVFVSSALRELAAERQAVRDAIAGLRLVPVMFELGARPHPPRNVYRAYLDQSQIFVGIYWQSYGWAAPGDRVSGLEDEYLLSAGLPRLIYVKSPAPEREPRLAQMLARIKDDGDLSYQYFSDPSELRRLVENDLAVLLSERFAMAQAGGEGAQDEPAGTLPSVVTPLVGREQDAEAAYDLVVREGVRLVSLTGPGGVGKSRLAVEVARMLGSQFPHGVRLVDLAPVQAADLVTAAIATAVGLRTSGGSLIADMKAYLRARRLVLVLDNFEQVTAAAPVVAELLAAAPDLVVLVTSRTMLRLSGEHEIVVAPLPTPPARSVRPGDLRRYASVRLFAERAHAVAPGFELTRANATAVAEICRRLDGLPLAIELAAAWVRLLPPQALLARLDNRLNLLNGGALDLPERQRTLRSTLDWSYDLLSPTEQALFGRLGVFAGTFDLEAMEAVGGGSYRSGSADPGQEGEILDTFGSLVHASLVRAQDRGDQRRFSLLDTIREYACERLRENGEWNDAHDRHAAHFLALAESAAAGPDGPGQVAWMDRLETEHANLGAAMSWFLDRGQPGPAHRLGVLTWRFWWFRGHAEEFARYAQQIIAMAGQMPPDEGGYAHVGLGFMLIASGDHARARALLEQGRAVFRRLGDKDGIAIASSALGHLATLRRDYDQAGELLREALVLQQELGHGASVALVYNFLGQIPFTQGDSDAAARLFTQGLDEARLVPDRMALLVSLYDLALARQARHDVDGAARLLREGLSVARDAGDASSAGYYLQRLAALARLREDPERAVCLLAAAEALLQAAGTGWLRAYVAAPAPEDDALPELRHQLGDAAFQQAWARGMTMSRQRAVAYALQAAGTSVLR